MQYISEYILKYEILKVLLSHIEYWKIQVNIEIST